MMRPILLILLFFLSTTAWSQSIFDSLGTSRSQVSNSDLVTETVQTISLSRRIFIITNNNNSFGKGDFITLLIDSQPVARALVAKLTAERVAGIKIVTIYSLNLWNQVRVGTNLQILRGDDSLLRSQTNQPQTNTVANLIKEDEDLFNSTTFLEDDLSFEENQNRRLKNDHLLSLGYAQVEGVNNDFSAVRYGMISVSYAYQIDNNIFIEANFGQRVINDFPALGLSANFRNLSAKAKYTFEGPYYTFIQPYVGYQILSATSDDAGQPDSSGTTTDADLQQELDLLAETEKNRAIFGVTALRRLVPGWFVRADLGNDLFALGLSLEF